jgi:hypothetical protein
MRCLLGAANGVVERDKEVTDGVGTHGDKINSHERNSQQCNCYYIKYKGWIAKCV